MSRTPLRVLHVISGVAPRYGGPTQAVLGMARALCASGVEAEIATTDADGPHGRLSVDLERRTNHVGVPCWFFRRDLGEGLKFSWRLDRWLATRVGDYDLVHVHGVFSHPSVQAGRAARRLGVPYVVRPLGTLDPWSLAQKPWRKRLFWWTVGRGLLHGAAAVHYTSETERRAAEGALGLRRGVVLPLGVDPAPASAPADDPPYLLTLGRLHPAKRIEVLLDAFSRLQDEPAATGWEIWIAGSGEDGYAESLRRRALTTCPGRVRFLGWVDGLEKARLLSRASLLVLPSSHENFGLAAAEAMAAGVPVLLSPQVDLSREVLTSRAGWVIEAAPEAVAQALRGILANHMERALRGAAGRRLAEEQFTWGAVAKRLYDLYQGLVRPRPTPRAAS